VIPHFPDYLETPFHDKECRAVPKVTPKSAEEQAQKELYEQYETHVRETYASSGLPYDAMCVCADEAWLKRIKCNCFRSQVRPGTPPPPPTLPPLTASRVFLCWSR
jgi:hypothetical protein